MEILDEKELMQAIDKNDADRLECVHHWIIAAASPGIGSWGKCKKCNRIQLFKNSIPDTKHLYNRSAKDKESN